MKPSKKDENVYEGLNTINNKLNNVESTSSFSYDDISRDECCIKAITKQNHSMIGKIENDSNMSNDQTVIEYVSKKHGTYSYSSETKKQAEIIKRLMEEQERKNKQRQQNRLSDFQNKSFNYELGENFDMAMQYIEEKIREQREKFN